ncbi:hypothetical protein B0H10DRAFT_2014877 [Mycena sp. CBHHK59/15]|nr:hypothetical protein B0H10DRAFT_2014877 [Mycena sp. CBHHK59/15]
MFAGDRSSRRPNPRQAPPPYQQWSYTTPGANYPQPDVNGYDHSISYPTSDRIPLLPKADRDVLSPRSLLAYMIQALLVVLALTAMWQITRPSTDVLDPEVRERIRREWDQEIRGYDKIRCAWSKEVAEHETIRIGWESERTELIAMREQLMREREEWARSREDEKREEERRGREEQRRRDEEERTRAGFYWEGLRGEPRCFRHGTRQYSARVANVPQQYDAVKACTETTVEIHGLKMPSPNQCEDRGCNGVYGHWTIDFSEPMCNTYFDNFKDKGCTSPGSRRRRIESALQNLQPGDDWRNMCSSTPADFRHLHFDSPDMCVDWGKYGIWGIWEIEDDYC